MNETQQLKLIPEFIFFLEIIKTRAIFDQSMVDKMIEVIIEDIATRQAGRAIQLRGDKHRQRVVVINSYMDIISKAENKLKFIHYIKMVEMLDAIVVASREQEKEEVARIKNNLPTLHSGKMIKFNFPR